MALSCGFFMPWTQTGESESCARWPTEPAYRADCCPEHSVRTQSQAKPQSIVRRHAVAQCSVLIQQTLFPRRTFLSRRKASEEADLPDEWCRQLRP